MQPVVTVAEMTAIDAEAPESVDTLIDRAGRATARVALDLLGGAYGRRVVVVAGPGNNGADGRVAATQLRRRGVRVAVVDALDAPDSLPSVDLVVDAAFGTGLRRPYRAPDVGDSPVLAVDLVSGLDGDTGAVLGQPMTADATVTFAAPTPGLLLGAGPDRSGRVVIADIGLDMSRASVHLVDHEWVASVVPQRSPSAHKWTTSVLVIAGGPGMTGASHLVAAAAQRAGAGMVRVAVPGDADPPRPTEAVALAVSRDRWAEELSDSRRERAVVVGPGLGLSMADRHQIRTVCARDDRPMVIDGDALTALGTDVGTVVRGRRAPTVLTPHDAEFARLAGGPVPDDRLAATRSLAASTGAVVLLKGRTTVIAEPGGAVRLVAAGDERLATAGTGDVLCGVIAAHLAAGLDGFDAAASAAHLHGVAGAQCPAPGAIASDVVTALPTASAVVHAAGSSPHPRNRTR